jgi:hypothetical protein
MRHPFSGANAMNKLILTAVITVAIAAGAGRIGKAQDQSAVRPDFSGKWVLTSNQPPGRDALGHDFSIAQDAASLTLDSTWFRGSCSSTGGCSETSFPVRTIYVLDAIEHPSQVISDQPVTTASTPTSGLGMRSATEESISKATWAGRQLVIMTYSRIKITALNRTPSISELRRTVRQALSMEADGTLAVESLIVADPLPWAQEAPSPTPVRSTYKKG